MDVCLGGAYFGVGSVRDGRISSRDTDILCNSNANGGEDNETDEYGAGSTSMALRPIIILSSETPWDDVKDLIGNYATY